MVDRTKLNPSVPQLRLIKRLAFAAGLEEPKVSNQAEAWQQISHLNAYLKENKYRAKKK